MANSKQIVYLSQNQYAELIANGTITVDGVTVTYDENDIYVTPQAEPITDVRVNGTSIAANGIANVPVTDNNVYGVTRLASDYNLKNGQYQTVVSTDRQHKSVFYGLAKAAGDSTQSASDNPVGTYTDTAKTAIKTMLGVQDGVTSVNGSTGAVTLSIPSTAADVGAIAAPSSPATGAFLVWSGSAWVAQTLSTWQGGNY